MTKQILLNKSLGKYVLILFPLFFLYTLSLPFTLPDFDAGEFAVIAVKGGIAHPPGYPLLSMLFQIAALFHGIAGLIPALSFVSVLCTTFGAVLLYHLLYEQTRSFSASALGIYSVFLSTTVWRAATAVEPFGLNLLLASVCLYAFWRILQKSPENQMNTDKWFFLSGAGFGLAFCNHHSLAFFLPFAVIVWWFGSDRRGRSFFWFTAGAGIGILPLLYFFSDMAHGPYVWGEWEKPYRQLIIHLFRLDYGTFSLMTDSEGNWFSGIFLFLKTLPKVLSGIFFVAAVGGLFNLFRFLKYERLHFRRNLIFYSGLGLSFLLTAFVFAGMMKTGPLSWHEAISERFFALPIILISFPIAFSGLWLSEWWTKKSPEGIGRRGIPVIITALIIFHGMIQWPSSERRSEKFYEAHVYNVFRVLEDTPVVLTQSDTSYFGLLYGKHVLNLNPDAALLQIGLWDKEWYRKRFLKATGLSKLKSNNLTSAVNRLLNLKTVYALDFNEEVKPLLKNAYPVGPLLRITGGAEEIPSPFILFRSNLTLINTELVLPGRDEIAFFTDWEASLLHYYKRTWGIMSETFKKYGKEKMAARCAGIEIYFTPQ